MALPQQRIVERVNERITIADQRQCQFIGLMPDLAVHDDFGVFLADQLPRALGAALRHHYRHRQAEAATGIGHSNPGIAAGRRDEPALALFRIALAGQADTPQLERTRGLQSIELEPDLLAAGQAQRA